ncbi:MAG: hypothetical protein V1932_05570 [Chloroflexota bacterium]
MRRLARVTQQLLLALLCAVILSIGWSSVAQADVPLPSDEEMQNNPWVSAAIEDAWKDSQVNDKYNRHEEGGWILQNIEYGQLTVIRVPSGTRAELTIGDPPSREGWRVVGFFHTHPSPPIDEFGTGWEFGPSDTDYDAARSLGLPGLIRDVNGVVPFGPHYALQTTPPPPEGGPLSGTWSGRYNFRLVMEMEGFRSSTEVHEASITMHLKQIGQDVAGIMILSDVKGRMISSDPDTPIEDIPNPSGSRSGGFTGKIDSNGNLNLISFAMEGIGYKGYPGISGDSYASASISGDSVTFNFGLLYVHQSQKHTYTGSFTVNKVSDLYDDSLFP